MTHETLPATFHPQGEQLAIEAGAPPGVAPLDTFEGTVKVSWDRSSAMTPLGQVAYFVEFRKVSGRLDALMANCPLDYSSPNAPDVRDVVGTWILSALAGHKRYAHVTALRSDGVLPELMGMSKIVSEDSLRRGLTAMPEQAGLAWLDRPHRSVHPPAARREAHRRYRYDGEAPLWASGGCRRQLQSEEAGTALPCASHLHDGWLAPRHGTGNGARQ